MARRAGWWGIAAYAAWSLAAVVVSGAEAGTPFLASALVIAFAYATALLTRAEVRGVRLAQRTGRAGYARGGHLHGPELFREA